MFKVAKLGLFGRTALPRSNTAAVVVSALNQSVVRAVCTGSRLRVDIQSHTKDPMTFEEFIESGMVKSLEEYTRSTSQIRAGIRNLRENDFSQLEIAAHYKSHCRFIYKNYLRSWRTDGILDNRAYAQLGLLNGRRYAPLTEEEAKDYSETILQQIGFDPELEPDELAYLHVSGVGFVSSDARGHYCAAIHHLCHDEVDIAISAFDEALAIEPKSYKKFAKYFWRDGDLNETRTPCRFQNF